MSILRKKLLQDCNTIINKTIKLYNLNVSLLVLCACIEIDLHALYIQVNQFSVLSFKFIFIFNLNNFKFCNLRFFLFLFFILWWQIKNKKVYFSHYLVKYYIYMIICHFILNSVRYIRWSFEKFAKWKGNEKKPFEICFIFFLHSLF